ncbi:GAF domain-containing protein [Sphaerisporangium sp. TRM90804]|uniref:GAF domain-containing protein n=1 Tax=Sphaerisporangium sp. TRM90804 TaxID=3031113 RepID=UPI0024496113|nr:GAF domain-containing protein [Sphaerisporangium sp. TRM90804]MDH2425834.1 GAF domain-containing protein [Sphaerisporangium sp. TRM90804]
MANSLSQRPKIVSVLRNVTLWTMTAGGAAGAGIFGALAGNPGKDQFRYLILVAVSVLLPIIANGINQLRASRAQRSKAEAIGRSIVTFRSLLSSAVYYLGKMADEESDDMRRIYGGHFTHAVVTAASTLTNAPDARSVFFRIQKKEMICVAYSGQEGRADPSMTIFKNDPDDRAGYQMFNLIHSGKSVLHTDIRKDPPVGLQPGRSYRTFIAAPVAAGDTVYGALTVDSPEANSLGDQDLQVMKTLAHLLGVGLALMPETA